MSSYYARIFSLNNTSKMNKLLKPTIFALLLFSDTFNLQAQDVFWAEHIAPIIYENCSSCHHTEGIAPFNLMSYDETVIHATDIHHVIDERSMPPWPADPAYRHFLGEAILQQSEIDAIHNWLDNGAPFGDENLEPDPPVFPPQGSLLEQIDYTVQIEPYTLQSNTDEYRWFAFENPFDEPVYLSKVEVIPGLEQVVHHADLFYDLSGTSVQFDQQDPLSGFNGSTGYPNNDYYINAWQPGANINAYPPDWGIEIPAGADLVFEIHYGPNGIGQVDDTKMNLVFVQNPSNVRQIKTSWYLTDSAPILVDGPLVIPPNELTTFHQQRTVNQDLSLVSICPHMHGLGKSYKVWFENPQGDSIPLINIPHWDFHWQKYYTFQQIQKIPAGSVLYSEGVYDNTTDNHDNPNNPPITVSKGTATDDEMFLCLMIYADYQVGDEDIVMDSSILVTTPVHSPLKEANAFTLFPNPTNGKIHLQGRLSANNKLQFQIRNPLGQVVYQAVRENNSVEWNEIFDVKTLDAGLYFLEWWDGDERRSVEFVKGI